MKAVIFTEYGSPDVLRLIDIEKPLPKDDEVLVKIHAVSINDWDWQLLQGIPFANRMINGLFKPKKTNILGSDIAGRIEAVGNNVKQFKPGDEVYGDLSGRWGGFAEYVCTRENYLSLKPSFMSFEEAAAIPQAAMLAVQGLIDYGQIQRGQKILINGAGGGVGTFGIQIAKLYDAELTGVDNAGKLELMRSIGFDHVIDYTQEDFTRGAEHYDLVLDTKTNRSMSTYFRILNPAGKYITVGGSTGSIMSVMIFGPLISLFSKKKARIVFLKQNKDLVYINELYESGKIKSIIDGPYELNEVPEVMRYFGEGKHKGKVIIKI